MNSVESFVFNYLATQGFIFGVFTICGLCLIPAICKSYLQWKKTEKQKDFMSALMQAILALLLLLSAYPIFVSGVLKINSMPLVSSGVYGFLLFALPIVAFAFFSSKAYGLLQKTKMHKSITNLTLTMLSSIASFYCISIYFIILLHQAILFVT